MKVYMLEYGYDWESGGETVLSTNRETAEADYRETKIGDWKRLTEWDSETGEYTIILES